MQRPTLTGIQTTGHNKQKVHTDHLSYKISFLFDLSRALYVILIRRNGRFHFYIYCNEEPFHSSKQNLICLDMVIFTHILSLSQKLHVRTSELEDENTLAYKSIIYAIGKLIFCFSTLIFKDFAYFFSHL